ncbi:MAG: phage baseplate assembly protein V [Cyanobacteria bacterium SBLK]|nr:phage baseplate assembly protein V [Cyanobacteria bacterium SBLK]
MKLQGRIGTIDATDYEKLSVQTMARVKLTDKKPGILTRALPVKFPFAGIDICYWMPKIGDRVIVILDENAEEGWIDGCVYPKQSEIGADSSNEHFVKFEDGTICSYDKKEHKFVLEVAQGTEAIELRGKNGQIKLLAKGEDFQIVIESEARLKIAAKDELEFYSDKTIKIDALLGTTIVELPNPRSPYFPAQSDSWFNNS